MSQRLLFWQNTPSIHQAALIRAIAAPGRDVRVITTEPLSAQRRALGWREPDFGRAEWVENPSAAAVSGLIASAADSGSVHIFSGVDAYPSVAKALRKAAQTNANVGVMAEAGDHRGWRGRIRRMTYRRRARQLREHLGFFLAMGETGIRWYDAAGFRPETLFPFGYFVDPPVTPTTECTRSESTHRFVYVGQLVARKGLDVLIGALRCNRSATWRLDVVGDGPEKPALMALCAKMGLADRVRWHGPRAHEEIHSYLAGADTLVLPSRFDGWGAVINEALLVGTPVVCTSTCGAADLIVSSLQGEVVRPEDSYELAEALAKRIAEGRVPTSRREVLRHWAGRISGPAAAAYLISIIDHTSGLCPRPIAPWREPT